MRGSYPTQTHCSCVQVWGLGRDIHAWRGLGVGRRAAISGVKGWLRLHSQAPRSCMDTASGCSEERPTHREAEKQHWFPFTPACSSLPSAGRGPDLVVSNMALVWPNV